MVTFINNHFSNLENNLKDILCYIKLLDMQKDLTQIESFPTETGNFCWEDYTNTTRKTLSSPLPYNAVVISLYGCLENFIDDILTDYILAIASHRCGFDCYPNELKISNILLTAEYLQNPQRFKNFNLDRMDIITKIHKGELANKLLIKHAGNLSTEAMNKLFKQIGIKNLFAKVKTQNSFINYYAKSKDIPKGKAEDILRADTKNISLSLLGTLIDKRNSTAHRWQDDDKISFEIIRDELIPFVSALCESVLSVIVIEYFQFTHFNEKIVPLKNFIGYSSTLVGFESCPYEFALNDYVIIHKMNTTKIANIIGIKESTVDCISNRVGADVSIKLSEKISSEHELYLMK